MTSAYPRSCLPDAKAHPASCTDYLVNACGIAADRVGYIYANFPAMRMFERGAPGVVAGMSGLAKRSGIHLRDIQLYEQRVQDINHASAVRLRELAKCLLCSIEDLME